MGENKVRFRNVAILLGVICAVLAAGLVGATAHYTRILNTKDSIIRSKDSQIQELETWLQGNITYYSSQVDSLKAQITNLQNEIALKEAQITTLNGTVVTLQTQYQAYVDAYQNLRDKVNQRWDHANVEPFITPQNERVRNVVYSVTGGWSNPSDWNEFWRDVKALYNWVIDNVKHRNDGLYPRLPQGPSESFDFSDEMWQFPNETLRLMEGDCEDQAILLCSMLRCHANMQHFAEVIVIESNISGHAAVQIPVSKNKLVILDPAGNYYSHDILGNIDPKEIKSEIDSWLKYWKPVMGSDVHVSRVFSDYMDKSFTSTQEYLEWMYSRS